MEKILPFDGESSILYSLSTLQELIYVKAMASYHVESGTAFPHSAAHLDERRRIERTAYSKAIMYKIDSEDNIEILNQNGHIFDISKAGMGIHTDYPLKPGSVIRFDVVKEATDYRAGIVRNTILIKNNLYRAGIEFIQK